MSGAIRFNETARQAQAREGFNEAEGQVQARETQVQCYMNTMKALGALAIITAVALAIVLALGAVGVMPMSSTTLGIYAGFIALCVMVAIGMFFAISFVKDRLEKNIGNAREIIDDVKNLDAKVNALSDLENRYKTNKTTFDKAQVEDLLEKGKDLYYAIKASIALRAKHEDTITPHPFLKMYAALPGHLTRIAQEYGIDFSLSNQ